MGNRALRQKLNREGDRFVVNVWGVRKPKGRTACRDKGWSRSSKSVRLIRPPSS